MASEPKTKPNALHVLIIGAGSVGLLIAQRLKTLGVSFTVFERENFLNERKRDWNFGVYWAQSWLTECLPPELAGRLCEAQVDTERRPGKDEYMRLVDGGTGEDLTRVPAPGVVRLRRSRFRGLLAEGVDVKVSVVSNSSSSSSSILFKFGWWGEQRGCGSFFILLTNFCYV